MSIPLPQIDMSVFGVGSSGTVTFAGAGVVASLDQYNKPAHVQIFNESGSGLQITFTNSGNGFFIPAGGWVTLPLVPGESGYNFTVLYKLTNPNVQQLLTTYYAGGELVPNIPFLGNSPVGGGVTSNGAQQLLNTGNPPGTNVINVQPNDAASPTMLGDNSGNLTIKGDNGGTLSTLLQLIAGASPAVKLAAAAILTEVLGALQVDGSVTISVGGQTGNFTLDSTGNLNMYSTGAGGSIQLGLNNVPGVVLAGFAGGTTYLKSPTEVQIQVPQGTGRLSIKSTGISPQNGTPIAWPNGSFKDISSFSGIGSGTYNHGLSTTPFWVCPIVNTAGSATQGYDSANGTTVHVTLGSSLSFRAFCYG